jgi:hypothetical protein
LLTTEKIRALVDNIKGDENRIRRSREKRRRRWLIFF